MNTVNSVRLARRGPYNVQVGPIGSNICRSIARGPITGHIQGIGRISSGRKELEDDNTRVYHETKGEVTTTTKGHHAADHMLVDSLKNSIDQCTIDKTTRTTQ